MSEYVWIAAVTSVDDGEPHLIVATSETKAIETMFKRYFCHKDTGVPLVDFIAEWQQFLEERHEDSCVDPEMDDSESWFAIQWEKIEQEPDAVELMRWFLEWYFNAPEDNDQFFSVDRHEVHGDNHE